MNRRKRRGEAQKMRKKRGWYEGEERSKIITTYVEVPQKGDG